MQDIVELYMLSEFFYRLSQETATSPSTLWRARPVQISGQEREGLPTKEAG